MKRHTTNRDPNDVISSRNSLPRLRASARRAHRRNRQRSPGFTGIARPAPSCFRWSATTRTRCSAWPSARRPRIQSGVAHILEHSVLCGSRKYPVKAPFLEMLKGSLKTFLNAMTYPGQDRLSRRQRQPAGFLQSRRCLSRRRFPSAPHAGDPGAGGLALRIGGARRAADLQGRRVQRDEGQLFLARRPRTPAVAAIALSRYHLWRRFRRRSAAISRR